MALPTTDIEIVKGEDNAFEIDISTDLDPTDEVWFTLKYLSTDTDANSAIQVSRLGTGGLPVQIVDVDVLLGICQVQLSKSNCDNLTGRAALYDVKVKKADQSTVSTVSKGVAVLLDSVNQDAA